MRDSLRQRWNLLWVLARMRIRSSDYRSLLGALWSFIGPVLSFGVLYFIFVDRFGKTIPHFPLKLLIGIIAISFFRECVQTTMNAIQSSRHIVLNSLTPSEILILVSLTVPIIKFTVEMSLCILISGFMGILPFQMLPVFALTCFCLILMGLGLGLFLAVLHSLATDVEEIWATVSQLLFFLSPIFYSLNMLSEWGRNVVYWCNPITPFIMTFQSFLVQEPVPYFSGLTVLHAFVLSFCFFFSGYLFFKKFERNILALI